MKKHRKDRAKGREHVPHIHEAMNDDGSMDAAAMEAALPEIIAAIKSGKMKILSGHQVDLGENEDLFILHRRHT